MGSVPPPPPGVLPCQGGLTWGGPKKLILFFPTLCAENFFDNFCPEVLKVAFSARFGGGQSFQPSALRGVENWSLDCATILVEGVPTPPSQSLLLVQKEGGSGPPSPPPLVGSPARQPPLPHREEPAKGSANPTAPVRVTMEVAFECPALRIGVYAGEGDPPAALAALELEGLAAFHWARDDRSRTPRPARGRQQAGGGGSGCGVSQHWRGGARQRSASATVR